MDVGLLYSGGKDSTLAAFLLDTFYEVTLVTVHFGITDDWTHARSTAESTGFAFETLELDQAIADEAIGRMLADGVPRNGIQYVHQQALSAVAEQGYDAIADGTRRDDRVPTVSRAQAQQLEDRTGVDYVAPLSGFGRRAVDKLVEQRLTVDVGPSETIDRADYEAELRALLHATEGKEIVRDIFPDHEQTHVRGVR